MVDQFQVFYSSPTVRLVLMILGILLFGIGLYGFYWLKRRRFSRLNQVGIEVFPTYGKMIATRTTEFTVRTFAGLATLVGGLLVAGFFIPNQS